MVTYSDSIFKAIVKSSTTTKRLVIIYIKAGLKAYQELCIDNIEWIKSDGNFVDGLIRYTLFSKSWVQERLEIIAYQSVIRPPANQNDETSSPDTDKPPIPTNNNTKRTIKESIPSTNEFGIAST